MSDGLLELLRRDDPEVGELLGRERERQETTIELIASENHVSPAVMHTMGSWLTNKYAEGYPGARYYGGCAWHDRIEELARQRAKALFGARFANVQPHSGATANTAMFMALMKPGETFASLVLKDGGHLSHGMSINFSGVYHRPVHYPLHADPAHPQFERIDYDAARRVCQEHRPRVVMCGYSAYPRVIDFARLRAIADEVGALLVADVAHIAGLCTHGGCAHPPPLPHAHVVTTTTHKTLRGPRGGLILTNDEELAKKLDKAVFPGVQGGPLMHVIAAKAVAFGEALRPEFVHYQHRVVRNAKALAAGLTAHGYRITTGGTDNHLMLVDLRPKDPELTGADAERWLEAAGIICNKNGIPSDPRPPKLTSGVRLGSPATTTRGMGEAEMGAIAGMIDRVLTSKGDADETGRVRSAVRALCERFPMPGPTTAHPAS
ncbi:MAG: serine hydroxymethyltransferase [Planctomyces sp.]|nr:serine hydroxymethyltransferase [Planctomyces sp.]MBA4039291.1 serine hydroxymethyltransferase [Planctomyces sp.]